MTIVLESKTFKPIIYTKNVLCQVSWQTNQSCTTTCEKLPKTIKKSKKRNLARNLMHMTTFFDSNDLNLIPNSVVCQVSWQKNHV